MLRHLVGPIVEVLADFRTVIAERPMPAAGGAREERAGRAAVDRSRMKAVENEDVVLALLRFADGTIGQVGSARIAWGRKNGPDLEIYGTRGALRFTQERMNELQLFRPSERADDNGFRTVLTGPAHPPYGRFTPAAGHGLGFNDLKTVEAAHLLDGIAAGTPLYPDFREGWAVEAVCDAMLESAEKRTWVRVEGPG
jgi:predicted dehydrogenase